MEDLEDKTGRRIWIRIEGWSAQCRKPPRVTYVCMAYGPAASSGRGHTKELSAFWKNLSEETIRFRKVGYVVVMGDLNVRLGALVGDNTTGAGGSADEAHTTSMNGQCLFSFSLSLPLQLPPAAPFEFQEFPRVCPPGTARNETPLPGHQLGL